MTTADSLISLTDEQHDIIERQADARSLVTAGAGTGKTLCLVRRLAHLVEEEDLRADEVLVLSFSRAAVHEIRQRLARAGNAAQHVDVRTFDSYATWLLSEVDPDGSWQNAGYDGRIRTATRLVREEEEAADLVKDLEHIVVDEVQDLVGDRAEFVKAILKTTGGGFTLLGDPAQGIYSFQLADREQRLEGAAALYQWIRERFGKDLTEATLSHNHRAREPEAGVALHFGPALGLMGADYGGIHRGLRTCLLDPQAHMGSLADAIPLIADYAGTPTAVLCRTNGQALRLSGYLREQGVDHRLQRSSLDRVVPAWVASLFSEGDHHPSRQKVLTYLEDSLREEALEPDEAWSLLRRAEGRHSNSNGLELGALALRLARQQIPDELMWQSPASLVVSTIHRAKGLEFDNVIVVDPGDAQQDPVEQAEEARLLYVAMTRPRDLLLRLQIPRDLMLGIRLNDQTDRWVKRHPSPKYRNGRLGMELKGDDIHGEDPAGTFGFRASPRDLQRYLATSVRPGAQVALTQIDDGDPSYAPRYLLDHKGVVIGATSASFARTLRKEIGTTSRKLPLRIEDVWIDCVETVTGSQASAQNHDVGQYGVWLRPRLVGLGRFVWPKKGEA
jgi:hypothetical protein